MTEISVQLELGQGDQLFDVGVMNWKLKNKMGSVINPPIWPSENLFFIRGWSTVLRKPQRCVTNLKSGSGTIL